MAWYRCGSGSSGGLEATSITVSTATYESSPLPADS